MIFHCFLKGSIWDVREEILNCLWVFCDDSVEFLLDSGKGSMVSLRDYRKKYGMSIGISIGFEAAVCGISIRILWKFYGVL